MAQDLNKRSRSGFHKCAVNPWTVRIGPLLNLNQFHLRIVCTIQMDYPRGLRVKNKNKWNGRIIHHNDRVWFNRAEILKIQNLRQYTHRTSDSRLTHESRFKTDRRNDSPSDICVRSSYLSDPTFWNRTYAVIVSLGNRKPDTFAYNLEQYLVCDVDRDSYTFPYR